MISTESQANFRLKFSGSAIPRLASICFEYQGEKTPGPILVAPGNALRDEGEISWSMGLASLAILLVYYRLRWLELAPEKRNEASCSFHEFVESQPYLEQVWNAVNRPTWIEDICGKSVFGQLCRTVFSARKRGSTRSLEINYAALPPENVLIEWDSMSTESKELLTNLLKTLRRHAKPGGKRIARTSVENLIFDSAEGIFGDEAHRHRLTEGKLIELNRQGIAARIRWGKDDLYLVSDLAVLAAAVEEKNDFDRICEFTALSESVVAKVAEGLDRKLFIEAAVVRPKPQKWNAVIFDWTNTLVEEYEHDEALCDFIQKGNFTSNLASRRAKFRAFLYELETTSPKLWYNYLHIGESFGKSPAQLFAETKRLKDRLRPLCDVAGMLRKLRTQGIKTVLATNCHGEILKWRAGLLGIPLRLFDAVITSDQVSDVRDKRLHFEIAIHKLNLRSDHAVVVSDDHKKDIVPAKALGFATVWVPARCHGTEEIDLNQRTRSPYGGPDLPPDAGLHAEARQMFSGRAADYCVPCADRVLRLIEAHLQSAE